MAKERKLISEERTDNVIRDIEGKESLRLSSITRESEEDDVEYYETIADNLEFGDGSVVNIDQLTRPPNQGGVTVKSCDICRQQSRSIFGRNRTLNDYSPNVRVCFHCRANLCSRHYYIFQNHIVCKSCRSKQFVLKKILKPIFFKRV